jgi:hypothetical protein
MENQDEYQGKNITHGRSATNQFSGVNKLAEHRNAGRIDHSKEII